MDVFSILRWETRPREFTRCSSAKLLSNTRSFSSREHGQNFAFFSQYLKFAHVLIFISLEAVPPYKKYFLVDSFDTNVLCFLVSVLMRFHYLNTSSKKKASRLTSLLSPRGRGDRHKRFTSFLTCNKSDIFFVSGYRVLCSARRFLLK